MVAGPFPIATTVGQGLFADASANGFVQGHAQPDPSTYWALRTGILAASETLPMWGGLPVYENVPGGVGNALVPLGPVMGRATTVTGGSKPIAGFSVFDQAYGMVQSPASPVQLAYSGMQVMSYRLGSGARIAVACDPSLVGLQQGPISAAVAWDFTNGILVPYLGSATISSGTYNSTTGAVVLTLAAPPAEVPSVGDYVTLASLTGTGAFASLNGAWQVAAGSSGTTLNLTATAALGAAAITGGTASTGTALPGVEVLAVNTTESMTVVWSSPNASWNFTGACALLQI